MPSVRRHLIVAAAVAAAAILSAGLMAAFRFLRSIHEEDDEWDVLDNRIPEGAVCLVLHFAF